LNWRIIGDPTEGALLTMAAKGSVDPVAARQKFPRRAELPFNSDIKMMATQHDHEGKTVVYIKGAPEALLNLSGFYFDDGNVKTLDEATLADLRIASEKMANSALRILAIGFIENIYIDGSKGFSPFQGKVTLLGLIGELDPPRIEVAESIKECQAAGIRPVMVTGDHKATGLAIAKVLGMFGSKDLAIDGLELDQYSDEELSKNINRISVFARVHPAQKLRIVEAFQRRGEIVAMTGDGVNDAPALVRANVGVAMGITGTEVAKEAAKIVIADDNFATIVAAITEGRLVYQNIKKLVLYLLSTSISELIVLFLALILGYPPPLAAVQILWINLVTEGTVTVNLVMEAADGREMRFPPTPPSQPLLDSTLLKRMPLMILSITLSTFGWFVFRTHQGVEAQIVQSETLSVLAVCQWFNVLNCRSATQSAFSWDLLKNPWLVGGLVLGNILHAAVIYWQPLSQFFHTVPIDPFQFFAIGAVASFVLWTEEIRKLIIRNKFFIRRAHESTLGV
jgi:Ca2+-transporting ATPase